MQVSSIIHCFVQSHMNIAGILHSNTLSYSLDIHYELRKCSQESSNFNDFLSRPYNRYTSKKNTEVMKSYFNKVYGAVSQ